jgi:ABC-type oligopeptide transport system ATPase subunit
MKYWNLSVKFQRMVNMERKLKKEKNRCRSLLDLVFDGNNNAVNILSSLLAGITSMGVVWQCMESILGSAVFATMVVIVIYAITFVRAKKEYSGVVPYTKTKHFMGLYNIEGVEPINNDGNRGLIPRNTEIKHLCDRVQELFEAPQGNCSMCIVGKSGSGKSTILNMLANVKDLQYCVVNFTGKYKFIDRYVVEELNGYKDDKCDIKYVAIFDQFEEFFALGEDDRNRVRENVRDFEANNVVIVFAIREEFFLQFMEEYNNHILMDDSNVFDCGILSDRSEKFRFILCHGIENESKVIEGLIRQAFGDGYYKSIQDYIKDKPLIQQEIVLNLLENEKEASRDYTKYLEYDENKIMDRYFDVQLCSTGDYFDASRIMYLLSVGRLNNICFTVENIKEALCIYSDRERERFDDCIRKLHGLKLIRATDYDSDVNYEVAHDYIAQSYEMNANSNMPSSVKNALDDYKVWYLQQNKANKDRKPVKVEKSKHGTILTNTVLILSIAFITAGFVLELIKTYSATLVMVFVLSVMSVVYVYEFYANITSYVSKCRILIAIMYLATMACGVLAMFSGTYWLILLGIGNSLLGVTNITIAAGNRSERVKAMFGGYGCKTAIMGILLALISGLIVWEMNKYDELQYGCVRMFIDLAEVVIMGALLCYSYISHLNRMFFYEHVESLIGSNLEFQNRKKGKKLHR